MSFLSSLQGISLFSLREGLTGQAASAGQSQNNGDNNSSFDQDMKALGSQVETTNNSAQVVNTEYLSYDPKVIERYGHSNVVLNDKNKTKGYVTNRGVFKKYENNEITSGENCPNGALKNINAKLDADGNYVTYTNDRGQSFLIYNEKYVMLIGSDMIPGQPCGYAGKNIYVGDFNENNSDNQFDYQGCKDASLLTPEKQSKLYKTDLSLDYKVPQCPAGTFATNKKDGFCYDPVRKNTVTTFMVPQYDSPIDSKKWNAPYLAQDGQTYLWFRSGGPSEFGQSTAPTMPACPRGTIPCKNRNGYCYHPKEKNSLVTTINPNKPRQEPKYMALVHGSTFDSNNQKAFLFTNSDQAARRGLYLQQWWPDGQFQRDLYSNRIYLQFKDVAAELMTYLNVGESKTVTIIARNYPDGGKFTVTKNDNRQAKGHLYYQGGNYYVTYNFSSDITRHYIDPTYYENGVPLWKTDVPVSNCGRPLELPQPTEFDEKLAQCREIANASFENPIYGFKDGHCYVGSSTEIGELLTLNANKKCASITKQTNNGQNGGFAAYKSGGSSDTSLFKYGFVTADETLREYPKGNAFFTPTNKFFKMGDNRVIRSPRFNDKNSFKMEHIEGGDILSSEACGTKCISTFSNNCEAYNFTLYGNTGKCTIYGEGSLGEKGIIIPSTNNPLYVREKKINNDDSCPKDFSSVKSSIWEKMPNQGEMTSTTKCNLANIMESDLESYNRNINMTQSKIDSVRKKHTIKQKAQGKADLETTATAVGDSNTILGDYSENYLIN